MKKLFTALFCLALAALLMAACGCDHEWAEANCYDPKTCVKCGATEGEDLGHDYLDANCEEPMTCSRCGKTRGEALGHSWQSADCENPMTCTVCGATQGEALGHSWLDATCFDPMTCSACGATQGEALGHSWLDATCEDPMTCAECGLTQGEALGHSWTDATYAAPKTCTVCGATEGEALTWNRGTLLLGLEDAVACINQVLEEYGLQIAYLMEDGPDAIYILYYSDTETVTDVYVHLCHTGDDVYLYGVETLNGFDEESLYLTVSVMEIMMVMADPTLTVEEIQSMFSQIAATGEDGTYYFALEKNGLIHLMSCNDDSGKVVGYIATNE